MLKHHLTIHLNKRVRKLCYELAIWQSMF